MKENYTLKSILLLLVFLFSLTVKSQSCADISQRVYASSQNSHSFIPLLGGGVSGQDFAIDGDVNTYSQINTGIAVLGIGTTYQTLSWGGTDIAAGTPVSVKLGTNSGLLSVDSTVTIQARRDGANVGSAQVVTSSLLSLVSGASVYEFTFIPESGGVIEDYDEVRITASAPLGIGFSVRVYEAYYHEPSSTIADCDDDIIDLFYGVENLGVDVLTATVGVVNPWNVADGNPATYATLQNGAAVLSRAQLTAVFSSPMQGSDELEISLSHQTSILSVEALSGFTIQRYNGTNPVGTPILSNSSLVSLSFLGVSDSDAVLIITPDDNLVYDRVKISLGGVAEVLNGMRIHEIKRRAGFGIIGVQDYVIHLEQGDSNLFTLEDPVGCTTFQVFDESNNPLTMSGNTFELPSGLIGGQIYSFYVQGNRYGCPFGERKQIVVIVSDTSVNPEDCPDVFNRVYATNQSWGTVLLGGTTSNPDLAVDGDPTTHSTITVALGVLGLGTTYQNLSWGGAVIPAGTPVSIKLGPDVGFLGVGSGLSVIGRRNGSNIGVIQNIDGALLSLISGENVYEYTFVPSVGGVPQEYDEIRIALGGVVAAGISVRIYEAYYHTTTETLVNCNGGDILDLFYGVEDLGVGLLTGATIGVSNPNYAVDGDPETYATFQNTLALLAGAQLTTVFSSPMQGHDELEISLSHQTGLLSVEALNGFSVQRYNGSTPVGDPLLSSSNLISINFLGNSDSEATLILTPNDGLVYDRIKISLGGVLGLLDNLRIHEIKRRAGFYIDGVQDNVIYFEQGDSNLFTIEDPTNCTTFQVFDEDDNPLTMTGNTFELPSGLVDGQIYTFYVQGSRYGCLFGKPKQIVVIVSDTSINPDDCPDVFNRVYATQQSSNSILFGSVQNPNLAVDGNVSTHSSLIVPIGVLGLGTTYQDLSWDNTISAGTAVTIKLSPDVGLVGVLSGLSVMARHEGVNLGNRHYIDGSLLSLVSGENVFEYTFVPNIGGIPQDYDEIRIALGGVVAAGISVKIYEAYHHTSTETLVDCGTGDVLDLFYGVEDLGIQVLTATVGVENAWDAVDGDDQTYATIHSGISVLAQAHLTVVFSTPTVNTDKLEINISKPGQLLTVGLLDGFSIQRYYGANAIGGPLDFSSSLLSLGLLNPGDDQGTIVFAPDDGLPYDRVKISLGGVATVLDALRIHEVVRKPFIKLDNSNNLEVMICIEDLIQFEQVSECTTYEVRDENGILLTVSTDDIYAFDLPDNVVEGNSYTYTVQASRYGCSFGAAQEITVIVLPKATVSELDDILVNGGTLLSLCLETGTEVELQVSISDDSTIINPVFVWYDSDGNLVAGGETGTLDLGVLTVGSYNFSVGVLGDNFCESLPEERKEVTFLVEYGGLPSDIDIDDNNDDVCFTDSVIFTPSSTTVTSPTFKWYLTNDTSSPIMDGSTDGDVTYTISALGVLSVTGLAPGTTNTYFVTVSGDGVCENTAGNLAQATVIVNDDIATPTTTDASQNFCLANSPTVLDIQVNESGVIWYDSATEGTAYDSTYILVSGTYYGALVSVDGCESSVRLAVTVVVEDLDTPTTTDASQNFCLANSPTVLDIQVNESGVIWYDSATEGTAYDSTDILVSGTYYGALVSVDGCESSVRLAVTVVVNDVDTPTTTDASQNFCLANSPTVLDIHVNESGVIWYDSATEGTAYDSTDILVSGTYYGALVSVDGCESSVRLAVTVVVEDLDTPTTTDASQNFCSADSPTVLDIQVNESGVIWYDSATEGTAYDSTDILVSGTYYGALVSVDGCESSVRLVVTVVVEDLDTPTTTDASQNFCSADSPTVLDIQVNESGVIWYDSATEGTAYDSTDILVSGTYYGALVSVDGCESSVRLAVTVVVNDVDTPTTTDASQNFCLANSPTVLDIHVNESGVIWYDSATEGTAYDSTDILVSGTYYGALVSVDGCESSVRLAVTVVVEDLDTPTTTDASQNFCSADSPTVLDIQVNESGVIWYDSATEGTAYDSTDILVSGTYYGALVSVDGCESSVRLVVTVVVEDLDTPTTTDASQNFCSADSPTVLDIQVNESEVIWYDSATEGTAYDSTDILVSGTYYGALVSVDGCESSVRLAVTVVVNDVNTPTTTDASQNFCLANSPTVLDIHVNESGVIWYDLATEGTAYDSTDILVSGTYYGALVSVDGCESSVRLVVTVVVEDLDTPTTTDASQNFCLADSPTVLDIQVNESGVIWYDSATEGTAYDSTDILVSGTYYGALVSVDGCESSVRLAVTVVVEDLDTPTTTDASQNFCLADSPTVLDIQVNESGVIWYDSATEGTAYDSTDILVSGTYYGALVSIDGCESSVRLAVTVVVNDVDTPTTTDASQNFCLANSPTVLDIQVNESGVIWYDSATEGTAYDSTDILVSGTYYGALVSVDGCESSVRLAVTVVVEDLDTPTTTDASQNFCSADSPTVLDIQVNESGVIWYDSATEGTAYDSTDILVSGTYYGALVSVDGCESSVRLAVTVVVEDLDTPTTTDASQNFCLADSPTVLDIQVNESGVIWYDSATEGTAYDSTDILVSGTYYGALVSVDGCESSVRLAVTVVVNDVNTPTTTDASQNFCLANSPTVLDIQVNESGVIWYDSATEGTAYDSTYILVSGTYYGALVSVDGCESSVRLAVTVVVEDLDTPTTTDASQNFCLADSPTVLDIQVNESGVIWYDSATEGTAYDSTDILVSGTYYGALVSIDGCESVVRLAITVNLIDVPSPTTDNSTLLFCVINQPTVSDLYVNEQNVIWYDAPVEGMVYDNNTPLVDGAVYYAALVTSEGCESTNLLAITVVMNDIVAPTTNATFQEFCLSDLPIISDIEVNELGVVWYDSITGGNTYASTDILVSGTYYAAQVSVDGCESSDRLEVEVVVHDGGEATITSDVSGDICLNTVVTYTTESGQSDYNWEVIGGEITSGGTSQDDFVTITWTSEGNTSVSVSYEGDNMCYIGDTTLLEQNVKVCADITISKEVNNLNPMAGEEIVFTVTVANSGPNDFDNVIISEVLQSGFSYISSETSIGIYSHLSGEWNINTLSANQIATLKIVVKVLESGDYMNIASIVSTSPVDADIDNNIASVVVEPICLFVFNEFSPNGDGSNEFFIISCIEDYPNNELKIFNKYGSLVYQHKGYNNTWNGIANTGGVPNSGEVLPSDTYYYVLELEGFNNPKKGWLFIMR